VSLVAILDADKEGFLRAERSLIQTCGRAARHLHGKVFMYADRITVSMKHAIDETERRRKLQAAYNKEHNITPRSVQRAILDLRGSVVEADYVDLTVVPVVEGQKKGKKKASPVAIGDIPKTVSELRKQMHAAAEDLDFEKAASLRDRIKALEAYELAARGA
jgi:excinuclease ABC subunit B